jgi:hypothetical protein
MENLAEAEWSRLPGALLPEMVGSVCSDDYPEATRRGCSRTPSGAS